MGYVFGGTVAENDGEKFIRFGEMVSTSSLTMEVKSVTHALRWIASRSDSQTTQSCLMSEFEACGFGV